MEAVLVDIVSKVVTPRATRAGTAFGSIQNENLKYGVNLGDIKSQDINQIKKSWLEGLRDFDTWTKWKNGLIEYK